MSRTDGGFHATTWTVIYMAKLNLSTNSHILVSNSPSNINSLGNRYVGPYFPKDTCTLNFKPLFIYSNSVIITDLVVELKTTHTVYVYVLLRLRVQNRRKKWNFPPNFRNGII